MDESIVSYCSETGEFNALKIGHAEVIAKYKGMSGAVNILVARLTLEAQDFQWSQINSSVENDVQDIMSFSRTDLEEIAGIGITGEFAGGFRFFKAGNVNTYPVKFSMKEQTIAMLAGIGEYLGYTSLRVTYAAYGGYGTNGLAGVPSWDLLLSVGEYADISLESFSRLYFEITGWSGGAYLAFSFV